jgi:hypothetical protein
MWRRAQCGVFRTANIKESDMGKYVLGWLLGVPVVVLVIIYLIFN